jgi:hypothetical protein
MVGRVREARSGKAQGEVVNKKKKPADARKPPPAFEAWRAVPAERQKRALKALMTGDTGYVNRPSIADGSTRHPELSGKAVRVVPATRAMVAEMVLSDRAKHQDSQRVKAQRPRGAGDDGRTMRDLIGVVTVWTHLQSAIAEWSGGECELMSGPTRYQYTAHNGNIRTITLRHFHAVRRKLGVPTQ